MTSGSSTIAAALMRGFSDEYGSWKTICMSRRAARMRVLEKPSTCSPRNNTSPAVGSIRRSMHRPVVLLPLPDSPTRANVSPSWTTKLTLSTARTTVLSRKSPPPRVKCLTRFRTSTSGVICRCSSAAAPVRRQGSRRAAPSYTRAAGYAKCRALDPARRSVRDTSPRRDPPFLRSRRSRG